MEKEIYDVQFQHVQESIKIYMLKAFEECQKLGMQNTMIKGKFHLYTPSRTSDVHFEADGFESSSTFRVTHIGVHGEADHGTLHEDVYGVRQSVRLHKWSPDFKQFGIPSGGCSTCNVQNCEDRNEPYEEQPDLTPLESIDTLLHALDSITRFLGLHESEIWQGQIEWREDDEQHAEYFVVQKFSSFKFDQHALYVMAKYK